MNFTGKVLIYYFSLKLIYMLISSYRVRCKQLKKIAFIVTLHLQINLDKSEQALLQDMSRTTRYKIRRAKKDGLTISYTIEPDSTDVKAFSDFYNSFARAKGIES